MQAGIQLRNMGSNQLVTRKDVESILNRDAMIGDDNVWLRIRSLDVYQRAFVHRSFVLKGDSAVNYTATTCNDVYEWAGDKCLAFCVCGYLTRRFPHGNACFLTNIFKSLIRGTALHRFARYHNFGRYILFSPRIEYNAPHRGLGHINVYEDAFEAFLEAIIRDFGIDDGQRYARRFLIATIEKCMDFSHLLGTCDNYKQAVQKAFQIYKFPNPIYQDAKGPRYHYIKVIIISRSQFLELPVHLQVRIEQYNRNILVGLSRWDPGNITDLAEGYIVGMGRGTKKAIAEQNCSKSALVILDHDSDII